MGVEQGTRRLCCTHSHPLHNGRCTHSSKLSRDVAGRQVDTPAWVHRPCPAVLCQARQVFHLHRFMGAWMAAQSIQMLAAVGPQWQWVSLGPPVVAWFREGMPQPPEVPYA